MEQRIEEDAITSHIADFWKLCGQLKYVDIEGLEPAIVVRYISGITDAFCNGIFRPKSTFVEEINQEMQFFQKNVRSFTWWLQHEEKSRVYMQNLLAKGFNFHQQYIGSAYSLVNHTLQDSLSPIEIISVENERDRAHWQTVADSSATEPQVADLFKRVNCQPQNSGTIRHFIAKSQSQVVGIATLFISKGIPGVWNLVISKERQKTIIEKTLVHRLCDEAKKMGCNLIVYFAPSSTFSLGHLGFKEYCRFDACTFDFE